MGYLCHALFYTNLNVQMGTNSTKMQFFLTNLGEHRVILGYPWFSTMQPHIDWAKGWIDTTQLPLILRSHDTLKSPFNVNALTRSPPESEDKTLSVGQVMLGAHITKQTMSLTLAE
jgi:hypothetical protein